MGIGLASPLTSISVSANPLSPPYGNLPNIQGANDTTTGLDLAVSQVLWNGYPGGPTKAVVDKSLLNLQAQELSTESGRLNLIFQVKQAYFGMFTDMQDLDSKKQILSRQNALLDQITAVYNLKQASAVDLKTAQINAHSAEIDVRTSEHTLRLARIRLAILVGMPPDGEFTVAQPDVEQVPAQTLPEAISIALEPEGRPQAHRAEPQVQRRRPCRCAWPGNANGERRRRGDHAYRQYDERVRGAGECRREDCHAHPRRRRVAEPG